MDRFGCLFGCENGYARLECFLLKINAIVIWAFLEAATNAMTKQCVKLS